MSLSVKPFLHKASSTFSYVVWEEDTSQAVVIDSVMDYDSASAQISSEMADKLLDFLSAKSLDLVWILETHAHADHLSAASYLRSNTEAKVAAGEGICNVQQTFNRIYNFDEQLAARAEQFDYLFHDGETFELGNTSIKVINTPGHTSDSVTYLMGELAFVGDTLFMPDYGTARCDFPGGSASTLYDSIQRIYSLPDKTKLYLCHDYVPKSSKRELQNCVSVKEQKVNNIHLSQNTSKEDFIELREGRDRELTVPALIIPSIQINIRAGNLPPVESNGTAYLKVPLNIFGQLD